MDREKKFRMIELWEQHPVLWDPTNPDRLRKGAQKKARDVIAAEFGLDEATVKQNINGLKAQLSGECSKVRKGGKSGAGGSEVYTSKWMYYSALQLLIRGKSGAGDFDSLNDTSQLPDDHVEEEDVEEELSDDHGFTNFDVQPSDSTTNSDNQHPIPEAEIPSGSKPKPVRRNLKRKKSSYDEMTRLSKYVDIMSEPTEVKKPQHRATLLGESTRSLLETLWTEDFFLYNEYAVTLRDLNNKFEQAYEERLIYKLSQDQVVVLSSDTNNLSTVGTETGNSEAKETASDMFQDQDRMDVRPPGSCDFSTVGSETGISGANEISADLPTLDFPTEPELD